MWRGQICLAGLIVLLLVVMGRCAYLQGWKSDFYRARADRQQLKLIPQSARRGLIVDCRGRVLAVSNQVYSAAVDPALLGDVRGTSGELADILSLDREEVYAKIQERRDRRFVWLKRMLSEEETERIRDLGLRGVILQREYVRSYPMGSLGAHVLGFTNVDDEGVEGVEGYYNHYLRGEPGLFELRMDSLRRPIGTLGECQSGRDGNTVVLSVDVMIQEYVEEQLRLVVEKYRAAGATGIVMDPKSGEVLALANWPTFEPEQAGKARPEVRRNRALTDPIEPGSTFKPFTLASALEGNYVTLDQKIDCLDGPYTGKGFGSIHEYRQYHGVLSVAEVIIKSSNIGTAKIAQKMGKKYFYPMIEKFGFGRKTGIDLSGEGAGILMPLKEWKWGEYALTRASYGQGPVAATPIQMIRGFCEIANGGKRIQPRVARGVLSPDGAVVEEFVKKEKEPGKEGEGSGDQIISEKVARLIVDQVLTAVVEGGAGTGKTAYLDEYRVFGKTGTAKVPKKGGKGYEDNKYISSFVGGAPAEEPKLCVMVIVYEPDRSLGLGYTGGRVAAPAVKEILRQSLAYLEVPARKMEETKKAGIRRKDGGGADNN